MKILLVDDDRDLVELLAFVLTRAGFEVIGRHSVAAGLAALAEGPDLAVLDVNLGEKSGFDLLQQLRLRSDIPVIMLTGRQEEEDKIRGLRGGADDYVTKPFSHRELVARIEAKLRRRDAGPPSAPTTALMVGRLTVDFSQHRATLDGRRLDLSAREYRLLSLLMANPGAVVSSSTLLREVWGYDDPTGSDVVRAAVHRLRRKLGTDPTATRLIQTVSGVGFMLSDN